MSATAQFGQENKVKLILAIVNQQHSAILMDKLVDANYRATLLSTTGGFLRRGNATLLIGVENESR